MILASYGLSSSLWGYPLPYLLQSILFHPPMLLLSDVQRWFSTLILHVIKFRHFLWPVLISRCRLQHSLALFEFVQLCLRKISTNSLWGQLVDVHPLKVRILKIKYFTVFFFFHIQPIFDIASGDMLTWFVC